MTDPRSLDHVIVSVRDLDSAAAAYSRLGFSVMPRAVHHNLGTSNFIVQFHDNYFELLGDYQNYRDPAMREFMGSRFEGGDGLAMVSLGSLDLAADRERLLGLGHTPTEIMNSSRAVVLGDGRPDTTASSSFLNWRAAPRRWSTMFYSHHDKPQTIWYAPWQTHANGVHTLVGIVLCSDDFSADAPYLGHMLGAPPAERTPGRLLWLTPRGECVEVLSPALLAGRFAAQVPPTPFPVWPVALRYRVADLQRCRSVLQAGGVPVTETGGVLTVAADHACGVVSEFTT